MAYTYSWPQTLPQSPQKGFAESIGINVIRSPMDAGPAKQRRRSARPNTLDVSFIMTTNQVTDLTTFIQTTLQGVLRFGFPHPRTNTVVECRVIPGSDGEFFKVQYLAPGYWNTALKLEILPT